MTDNVNEIKKKGKLSFGRKLGYAIGQFTDSTGFGLFGYFFLFFLTDCAGIDAGVAGIIVLIAGIYDAVTDPVAGYISDNLRCKYGRRRPMMITGAIPYAICTFLLFSNFELPGNMKIAYFLIVTILFWTFYKIYVIPYFALGAELTDDFNERTSLRSWAGICLYIALMIATVLPPVIADGIEASGRTMSMGWSVVGILFGAIILITALICWNSTRGGELSADITNNDEDKESVFHSFASILKLKPIRTLGVSVFAWGMVTALISASLVYLMDNNLGYSAARQSGFFLYLTGVTIVLVPVINLLAQKFDKKKIYSIAMLLSAFVFILFGFIGFPAFALLILFITFVQFGDGSFWTLYYAMMYDISELDEFINGKRREGVISAVLSFAQKIGGALAGYLVGALLEVSGYDGMAEVQVQSAHDMINALTTYIPGALALVAGVFGLMFPITGKRFTLLMNALEAKRNHREYTTDGFEKLL